MKLTVYLALFTLATSSAQGMRPDTTESDTFEPTMEPTEMVDTTTSMPSVKLPFSLCPLYNLKQDHCVGCQYCPDGTLCPECFVSYHPTKNPTLKPTKRPTPIPYYLCPVFEGSQVQCMGCQICPDLTPCPSCEVSTQHPSFSPTIQATNPPTFFYDFCPMYNGTQVQCTGCQMCPDKSICKSCPVDTISPSMRPSVTPTIAPSALPTIVPTQKPTIFYDFCPMYNGTKVQCTGCQMCPDRSICKSCGIDTLSPTMRPTVTPTLSPSALPTLSPTLRPTIPYQLCPVYNNTQVQCMGCQICPDRTVCKGCKK